MHIIPVIDICKGQVVHAVRGQRAVYQPVQSRLCAGSEPCTIVQALLNVYPFTTLYIADLDSINGNQENNCLIDELHNRFGYLDFWVDNGKFLKEEISGIHQDYITRVIGSETGVSPDMLRGLVNVSPQPVLSLDFKENQIMGDPELIHQTDTWPDNIIIMNLSRVGSSTGPDLDLLHKIRPESPEKNIYMAGGIRNINDLRKLEDSGVAGVLVATALHNRALTGREISTLK